MDAQTERDKMIAGQLYRASDAELVAARIRARRLVRAYNATDPEVEGERRALWTGQFEHIGDNAMGEPPFHCDYGWNILLGAGAYVNVNCVIIDCAPVTIGALTMLGPGVTIGDNSTIGAGSVVLNDVPANVVVAGNPSRIVRHL